MQIALHRRGPDVLPASSFLFGLLLVGYLIASLFSLNVYDALNGRFVLLVLVDCVLFLGCVLALLRYFKRARRFLQTGAAILGVDVLLTAIGIPLTTLIRFAGGGADPESVTIVVDFVRLALVLWWIDIASFIVSRALDQPYVVGLVFVILYWTLSLSIGDALLPASS